MNLASIITAGQFTEITGVTPEEVGEEENSGRIRDNKIAKAQLEFFRDAGREFVSTDPDYTLAQEAIAYLTAHKIATLKRPLVANTNEEPRSPYYYEYKRILNTITKGSSKGEMDGGSFQGAMELGVSQEDSADYVADMPSE